MNHITDVDLEAAHEVLDEMVNDLKTGKITYADDILQALMFTESTQRTLAMLLTVALQRLARDV